MRWNCASRLRRARRQRSRWSQGVVVWRCGVPSACGLLPPFLKLRRECNAGREQKEKVQWVAPKRARVGKSKTSDGVGEFVCLGNWELNVPGEEGEGFEAGVRQVQE